MKRLASVVFAAVSSLVLAACEDRLSPTQSTEVAKPGLHAAALDQKAHSAVIGSTHHGVSLWRLSDQERLYDWHHRQGEPTTLVAADFSPEGQWAITADSRTLALWNVATGEAPRFWSTPGSVHAVELGRNGDMALLGLGDHDAVLFDVRNGGILRTFKHRNRVTSVGLSRDGSIAVTGSQDHSAVAWETTTAKKLAHAQHQDEVHLVTLSDDGSLAFSVSKYDRAIVWRTSDGKVMGVVHLMAERLKRGQTFTAARFGPDNAFLLTGGPDQTVTLWSLEGRETADKVHPIAQWKTPKRDPWKPSGAAVLAVAFAEREGVFYAITSDGFVHTLETPALPARSADSSNSTLQ